MVKETQKAKIERLEKELNEYKVLTLKLQKEIYEMQEKAEDDFINSPTYIQYNKKIDNLERENKILKGQLDHKEKVHKLKDEKKHNERGAGRNPRFTNEEINKIKESRADGKTIKELARDYKCSTGLIHKLING